MESPHPHKTGYILLIEDDLDIQELLQLVLAEEGFHTVGATDGQAGLDRATEREPALVVLDINLPILSGVIVANELHRLYDRIPILVVTANTHAESQAREARAFGYLQKPFDVDALLAAVQTGLLQGRAIEHHRFPDLR